MMGTQLTTTAQFFVFAIRLSDNHLPRAIHMSASLQAIRKQIFRSGGTSSPRLCCQRPIMENMFVFLYTKSWQAKASNTCRDTNKSMSYVACLVCYLPSPLPQKMREEVQTKVCAGSLMKVRRRQHKVFTLKPSDCDPCGAQPLDCLVLETTPQRSFSLIPGCCLLNRVAWNVECWMIHSNSHPRNQQASYSLWKACSSVKFKTMTDLLKTCDILWKKYFSLGFTLHPPVPDGIAHALFAILKHARFVFCFFECSCRLPQVQERQLGRHEEIVKCIHIFSHDNIHRSRCRRTHELLNKKIKA